LENLKEIDHLEGLGRVRGITLKLILKEIG
jgi:hypothetical protein